MRWDPSAISKAYDLTVEQYREGVDPLEAVPERIRQLPGYCEIVNNPSLGSGAEDIKAYLRPEWNMRLLDAGCCANLENYGLDNWPSTYYGVDVSPALIDAMKTFAHKNRISIGGLYHTDIASMPFDNDFFQICMVIGVMEYCTLEYSGRALRELHRVLQPGAKMVLDIPNINHPFVGTMFELEEHLQRPHIPKERKAFEQLLAPLFRIDDVNDTLVMLKYFVRATV